MSNNQKIYQIRLSGHLDFKWSDWFEGMAVSSENVGDTTLTGPVPDQAALHGLFRKIRDLGLPLVSVHQIEKKEQENENEINK